MTDAEVWAEWCRGFGDGRVDFGRCVDRLDPSWSQDRQRGYQAGQEHAEHEAAKHNPGAWERSVVAKDHRQHAGDFLAGRHPEGWL